MRRGFRIRYFGCAVKAAGSALLLCLVLLTSLTLLGLAAAADRQLQVRVTANIDHAAEARMAADGALGWAEDWLFSLPGDQPPVPCEAPCPAAYPVLPDTALPPFPERLAREWWAERGHRPGVEPMTGTMLDPALAARPARWIVTAIEGAAGDNAAAAYYRVLAWGQDREGLLTAVSESIVARPWGEAAWSDPLPLERGSPDFCRSRGLAPCGRSSWRRLR